MAIILHTIIIISEKINERLFNDDQQLDVQKFLKDFVEKGQKMEKTMAAANVLCSTCVFIKPGIIIIIIIIMFIYTITIEKIGSSGFKESCNEDEEEIGSCNDQFPKKWVQCIQAIQSALPNVYLYITLMTVKFIINAGKSMFAPCATYECTGFSC